MSHSNTNGAIRGYVQLFVYRVPKKNREALRSLLRRVAEKLGEHGTLRPEFYWLHSAEAFQGFTTISSTFTTGAGEELWVELDYYTERGHRDQVMANLSRDASAGALFRQLGSLVSAGYSIVMGEFEAMAL